MRVELGAAVTPERNDSRGGDVLEATRRVHGESVHPGKPGAGSHGENSCSVSRCDCGVARDGARVLGGDPITRLRAAGGQAGGLVGHVLPSAGDAKWRDPLRCDAFLSHMPPPRRSPHPPLWS
jgi:hypothetical protein